MVYLMAWTAYVFVLCLRTRGERTKPYGNNNFCHEWQHKSLGEGGGKTRAPAFTNATQTRINPDFVYGSVRARHVSLNGVYSIA